MGNKKIQCGYSNNNHVNFAEPFTGEEAPLVFCTICSMSEIHAFSITVYNQTHTGFDVKKKYVNANEVGNADEVFFWLAIGD